MSAGELAAGSAPAVGTVGRRGRFRLLRSELAMVFRRPRNIVAMVVPLLVPVVIAVAVKLSSGPQAGDGPQFLSQVTQNGVFVALSALVVVLPFFLPLAVSVVAGDTLAGEAQLGTLRYLLTVPVERTRLLVVKYTAAVAFAFAVPLLIAAIGVVVGLLLFPGGRAVTLSGTEIGFGAVLWRLLLVALYVGACMAAVTAFGLFVSALVGSPLAATGITVGYCVTSLILGSIPQLDVIHPYLINRHWLAFGDLLRDPMAFRGVLDGLLSVLAHVALFGSLAWARLSGRDVVD